MSFLTSSKNPMNFSTLTFLFESNSSLIFFSFSIKTSCSLFSSVILASYFPSFSLNTLDKLFCIMLDVYSSTFSPFIFISFSISSNFCSIESNSKRWIISLMSNSFSSSVSISLINFFKSFPIFKES